MLKALISNKVNDAVVPSIGTISEQNLPLGDVLVKVTNSSLNYTDARTMYGKSNIIKTFPHVSGIDFAGLVERSDHPNFAHGDKVIHTGWGVGHERWGGYAQKMTSNSKWLVKVPSNLSCHQAMIIGTAGLTSMLAIMAFQERGLQKGRILVTGSTGGVGSLAIYFLSRLGYTVIASTGKLHETDYLKRLGASEIITRTDVLEKNVAQSEKYHGIIDTVGSTTLSHAIDNLHPGGIAASCGFVASADVPLNLIPFLIDGVSLLGINSLTCPIEKRQQAWDMIAGITQPEMLEQIAIDASLEELPSFGKQILDGKVRGRVVVNIP